MYYVLHIGLGLPGGGTVPKDAVIQFFMDRFPSFTVTDAQGVFSGVQEPVLIIGVSADKSLVYETAEIARKEFGWEGIGILEVGNYDRVS